jgi:hypothetical protein
MSEYMSLGDTIRFGITITNPIGGALINADETPRWYVYTSTSGDNPLMQGAFSARANLMGTYNSSFVASSANNFITGDYCEVHASGKVSGTVGRAIIKTFVLDDLYSTNVIQVSGVRTPTIANAVWDEPRNNHLQNECFGSGLAQLSNQSYFAAIKFVKDSTVPDDEYTVQWFRNFVPIASGDITKAAISVFKTDGTNGSLFTNKVMNYTNVNDGAVFYSESTNLAVSGQAYLAITSGTIDSATRMWSNVIGLDYL